MKRPLLVLVAAFLLAVVAVGIFIATFDAERYRPLLVSQLEQALGKPVQLDRLALGWRQGIALQLDGFAILDDAGAGREPLLHVDSASALVRLMPLFRKEVQVASVVLGQPRIHVSRDAQGDLNVLGLAAAAGPAAAPSHVGAGGGAAVSFNIDSLRIEDGALHWTDAMARPPTDLWLKKLRVTLRNIAPGRPMDLDVTGALAGETPNFRLSGRLTLPRPQGGSGRPGLDTASSLERLQLTIERLRLEDISPAGLPGEPQLRGQLTVTLEGSAATLEPTQWTRAVSGSGRVNVDEPVVTNLNLLRAVFEKFAMIPGLVQTLEARLPPDYQARLAARDTILDPIALAMTLEAGVMRFGDFTVRTDTFEVSGTGSAGLDGTVSVQSILRIEPAFSSALIGSVKELSTLTNAKGEMEIPVTIRGQAPRIAVLPDLQYLTSKVIVTKAVDLLGSLLQQETGTEGGEAGADQPASPEHALIGQVLRRVLEPASQQ